MLIKLWYDSKLDAGWSSLAARRAHNPKVVGSNPAPATPPILLVSRDFMSLTGQTDIAPGKSYILTVLLYGFFNCAINQFCSNFIGPA